MKSSNQNMERVSRYLDNQMTEEEVAELEALMLVEPQLRADFLRIARIDAALPSVVAGKAVFPEINNQHINKGWIKWLPVSIAAALVLLAGGLAWVINKPKDNPPETIGSFTNFKDCRWMDPSNPIQLGDPISPGDRIELSSGSMSLEFKSGAKLKLFGPAIARARDASSLFLSMGEARVLAETEQAKGFTVVTPSSKFVDISTAFTTTVSPDGLSRLDVTEGEVDVILDESGKNKTKLQAGQALYVEPGENKILTRIEQGNGTKAFRFPTIPPPSSNDFADQSQGNASAQIIDGTTGKGMRLDDPLLPLMDGKGQQKQDSPNESVFFANRMWGSILVDLGKPISVSRVTTYSWHQHKTIPEHRERATQKFSLYGYNGDSFPISKDNPQREGLVRIARVNSDRFFKVMDRLGRPSQQACSISAANGSIGTFRFLLMEVGSGTFFGEIDIFDAKSDLKHLTK